MARLAVTGKTSATAKRKAKRVNVAIAKTPKTPLGAATAAKKNSKKNSNSKKRIRQQQVADERAEDAADEMSDAEDAENNEKKIDQADADSDFFRNAPKSWYGKDNGVNPVIRKFWTSSQRRRAALKWRIVKNPYGYLKEMKLRGRRHRHIKPRATEGYEPIDDHLSDISTDNERRDDRCFMLVDDYKRDNAPSEDSQDIVFGGSEARFKRWGHC